MIQQNIAKLKRFMEICDAEIFPGSTCKVYIANKRYRERGMASFNLRDASLDKTFVYLCIVFLRYIRSTVLYFFSRKRIYKCNKLRYLGLIGYHRRRLHKTWYQIVLKSSYASQTDLELAYIAWHEVRHRVQFLRKYTLDKITKEQEEGLLASFRQVRPILDEGSEISRYHESEFDREVDANFIAWALETYAKREFENLDSISEEIFKSFVITYTKLLTWKNPDLELLQF